MLAYQPCPWFPVLVGKESTSTSGGMFFIMKYLPDKGEYPFQMGSPSHFHVSLLSQTLYFSLFLCGFTFCYSYSFFYFLLSLTNDLLKGTIYENQGVGQ